jgi:prepilin peptidase CpaA
MNLALTAPDWLAWALGALLVAAAAEDAYRLRISNIISIALLVLALVAMAVVGFSIALWENGVVFAAILAIGTFLFGRGWLGGGDVKLLASLGLWFDLEGALRLVLSVLIAGGVLALVILALRMVTGGKGNHRIAVLNKGAGIPYGIAIAAGALITLSARS